MIDATTLPAFLHRFRGFCDSLLLSVSVEYLPTGKRHLRLELRARDWAETQSDRWQVVRIVLADVGDYRFSDKERQAMSVLSDGTWSQSTPSGAWSWDPQGRRRGPWRKHDGPPFLPSERGLSMRLRPI